MGWSIHSESFLLVRRTNSLLVCHYSDDECAGDLKCFFFDAPEPVPGCVGPRKSYYDYCWDRPSNYLWEVGNDGVPASAFPLKECEGDCDVSMIFTINVYLYL